MSVTKKWVDKKLTIQPTTSNEFATPTEVFDYFNKEFSFTWDLSANSKNTKCDNFYSVEDNSLVQDWHKLEGWLWLNPPYTPLRPWVEKAQQEYLKGAKICILMPPVLNNHYFHKILPTEIRFIVGRIKFIGADGIPMRSNAHDSCLVIYGEPNPPIIKYIKIKALNHRKDSHEI